MTTETPAGLKLATFRRDGVLIERRRVTLGRSTLTYEASGSGSPIVLVHGLSGSSAWWRFNVPALSARHRVIAVNLFRFGGSGGRGRFVLTRSAAYLDRLMDALGLEKAHFVGHSMGGFICLDLAAEHPERVDRLVLVNAAALPFDYGYIRHAYGLAMASRYLGPRFLAVLAQDALTAGPLTLLGAARQLLTTDIRGKLERVEAPTLVVWGLGDTVVPMSVAEGLREHLPDVRYAPIARAGHNPMWDQPGAFNEAVLGFLAEGAARAAESGGAVRTG